jgi:hypothetical protein
MEQGPCSVAMIGSLAHGWLGNVCVDPHRSPYSDPLPDGVLKAIREGRGPAQNRPDGGATARRAVDDRGPTH